MQEVAYPNGYGIKRVQSHAVEAAQGGDALPQALEQAFALLQDAVARHQKHHQQRQRGEADERDEIARAREAVQDAAQARARLGKEAEHHGQPHEEGQGREQQHHDRVHQALRDDRAERLREGRAIVFFQRATPRYLANARHYQACRIRHKDGIDARAEAHRLAQRLNRHFPAQGTQHLRHNAEEKRERHRQPEAGIGHAGKRLRPIRAAIHPPQYAEAQNEGKRDAGRTRKHIFKVKTCHLTFFY